IPKNKLIAFPSIASTAYQYKYAVGHSIYSTYMFHNTGVSSETGLYEFHSNQSKGDTTSPSYPQDLALSKPVTQKYFGGFQNSFSYKGFRLDVLVQFVKQLGHNYYYSGGFSQPGAFNYNQPVSVLSRWQKAGDISTIGKFSTIGNADPNGNLLASDFTICDASFIRIKNVSISYELPAKWDKTIYLRSARVYIQGQNLLTFTKYPGLDPESQGLALPPLRMIT